MVAGFAIGAVIAIVLVTQIGGFLTTAFASEPTAVTVVTQYTSVVPGLFGWFFMILVIAIPLLAFALAVLVPVNPVWYFLFVALSLPFMLFASFIADVWGTFSSPTIISDALTTVPALGFVMDNFLYYAALYVVVIGIGTYVKIRRGAF